MGQIIVRVIAGLASIATALVVNAAPAFKVENRLDFKNSTSKVVDSMSNADGTNDADSADSDHNTIGDYRLSDNPNGNSINDSKLPEKVASSLKNKDEVVSSKYALTSNGKLKSLKTGKIITDSKIVGTKDKQPDPLVKSNGERFTPISVGDLRKDIKRANKEDSSKGENVNVSAKKRISKHNRVVLISNTQNNSEGSTLRSQAKELQESGSKTSADLTSDALQGAYLPTNGFGTRWGNYNGTKAFYTGNGNLFAYNARGVIDVSEHQKEINWAAAKNAGVEGAIIRISYGWDNGYDKYALRNINECKRLGIPFGIYIYSYAETPADGANEGADVAKLLRNAGVSPSDLSYPVYYDLEKWVWVGHTAPNNPYVYQNIVSSWWNQLYSAGYTNLGVYSYASYANGPLNSQYIHDRLSWIASYGATPLFNIRTTLRGWQYTSSAVVPGIEGNVDVSVFGNMDPNAYGDYEYVGNGWKVSKVPNRDFWTNGTQSHVLQYQLRESYYMHGGFARLGAPVADEENIGGGWWRQRCQNGDVWTHGTDTKFVIQFELRGSYYKHGDVARLGVPVAEEENMGGGWWRQRCQNGDVWTHGTDKKLVIQFELRGSYYSHGGAGWLGAPVADEENIGGGWWRQRCKNGDVWTYGSGTKLAMMFNLRDAYYKNGDANGIGVPVAEEENMGGGWWRQRCQNGDVWTQGTDKKLVIQYELRSSYYNHGGAGWLGAPVASEENMGDGWWRQRCQNGDVWTQGRNTKRVVMFNLRKDYYKRGGFEKLGAPVEDEHNDGNGLWRQKCQKGVLEAH